MEVLKELKERGFLANLTDPVLMQPEFADQKLVPYIGFDLTAPSLHVGSLIQLRVLKKFMAAGHNVIVLLGDATTMVGDPTGKDKSRPMIDYGDMLLNRQGIARAISNYLGMDYNPARYGFAYNEDWFKHDKFLNFMQEFGPHFTINRVNTLDVVKRRLDNNIPMSFLEYTYVMLQSVDFLRLHERHNVSIQIGGSDQWGNIVNGVDLVRRMRGETVYGITTNLLTTSSGEKMGKTSGGAVWLDPRLTSPFDFFQFWRNIPDDKVAEFMLLFTDIPVGDEKTFIVQHGINAAKEWLAFQITCDVHGEDTAKRVLSEAQRIFVDGEAEKEIAIIDGMTVIDVIHVFGMAPSRKAARRLLGGNAVSVDGDKIHEDQPVLVGNVIRVGKKHSVKVIGWPTTA